LTKYLLIDMMRITESPSHYNDLEKKSVAELVRNINKEDQTVARAVEKAIPQIIALIDAIVLKLKSGGRLFYIGAGTSGRLGVLDASECPPTYGVDESLVTALMAGGDAALRYRIEDKEDEPDQGWKDLLQSGISEKDLVVGIAASGTTPYVTGALEVASTRGIETGCIVCNPGSPVARHAKYPVELITGPEFVTGSTRMKAGTAQKMVLNIISTASMIMLGHVKGNRMVKMQLTNKKLIDRGTNMLMQASGIDDYETARKILLEEGSVSAALEAINIKSS